MSVVSPHENLAVILERLFDYAGMFPPASLSFEAALAESARFPQTLKRPSIMGADLVLDVTNACNLVGRDLARHSAFTRAISICLLASEDHGRAVSLAEELPASTKGFQSPISVSSIEAKVQPGSGQSTVEGILKTLADRPILLALEPDLSSVDWLDSLHEALEAARSAKGRVALKCRATGPTGIGPARLARALSLAADAGLPFKVTGGFHHPIVEPGIHSYPMGFLNLAAAVLFRRIFGEGLSAERIADMLTNSLITNFSFARGLAYEDLHLDPVQLRHAKASAPFSIGSCSLTEPDQDLARLLP